MTTVSDSLYASWGWRILPYGWYGPTEKCGANSAAWTTCSRLHALQRATRSPRNPYVICRSIRTKARRTKDRKQGEVKSCIAAAGCSLYNSNNKNKGRQGHLANSRKGHAVPRGMLASGKQKGASGPIRVPLDDAHGLLKG